VGTAANAETAGDRARAAGTAAKFLLWRNFRVIMITHCKGSCKRVIKFDRRAG